MSKPFSEACVQNRTPILNVIEPLLAACEHVLEVGSGTGQHAVYFANAMPHLCWQTSDCAAYHAGINAWLEEAKQPNILPPILFDVSKDTLPEEAFDAVFSANTLHIMSSDEVICFFNQMKLCLKAEGVLMVYGPFNYGGQYTSDSNARFDQWLHSRNTHSGIKAFEWVNELAEEAGLICIKDYAMPANNRLLYWQKCT